MTESVRHQWIYTMHHRASIHDAMTLLTNHRRTTSEQHIDLGQSRRQGDISDIENIIAWFNDHNPFTLKTEDLQSLSTGLTANEEDNINCYDAEAVGARIQAGLNGVSFSEAKIKRSQQVRVLQDLQPGIKIRGMDG